MFLELANLNNSKEHLQYRGFFFMGNKGKKVLNRQFLAHLSRRLIGELLVYRGIRPPSVRRPSVVNIFKRLRL